MTAFDNQPSNFNILSQINFRFILKRAPSFVFCCTKCNVPGITSRQSIIHAFRPNPCGDEHEFRRVMEDFDIDYTPMGHAAFYAGQENAPEGVNIRMRFIELEYWISGNFNDSNDVEDVYTNTPVPAIGNEVMQKI